MTDIFREIEEDIRRQQIGKIWQRYGTPLTVAAAVLVVGIIAYLGWRTYDEGERAAATRALSDAVAPEAGAVVPGALESVIADSPAGIAALAKLRLAALKASENREAAIALYDEVVASDPDPMLGDAARYRAALLAADIVSREALEARLAPLLEPESAWRFLAQELAAYAAFRAKDEAAARERYSALAGDLQAPGGVRERAEQMLTRLAPLPAAPAGEPDPEPAPAAPEITETPTPPPSDPAP
ncbi:MAG: tetratricopeptide repeat protein [Alphaproteobacteria bacterium]|nr:tetratricopeptide repeat protein [Alphaproteobacteria bacterium]